MPEDVKPQTGGDHPLELDGDQFADLTQRALVHLSRYIDSLPSTPAMDCEGGVEAARSFASPMPEHGDATDSVLDELFSRAIPKGFNTASPGYLAYIPGGGILASAVADFIACAVNRYVGVWQASPGLAQIESTVIRWFCELVGYPSSSGGYLSTGGSMANWTALVTARCHLLSDDFLRGTLYVSDQGHHSLEKAALLAGFPRGNIRVIPTDSELRLSVPHLRDAIGKDRKNDYEPFLVLANGGTTNTGAVDDISSICEVARDEGLWTHVDAAYGGFFLLTERGRKALSGIEGADSVTLDPHKGLFLPYGTGCLLVRDLRHLRAAHSVHGEYMPDMQVEQDLVDFCEISPELSRDARGLRLWFPFRLYGAGAFRKSLEEKLDLARLAYAQLIKIEELEVLAPPELSIVAFRLKDKGGSLEVENQRNEDFLCRINDSRRVFLTGTKLDGRFTLRICVLSFRTHEDRMLECFAAIQAALGE